MRVIFAGTPHFAATALQAIAVEHTVVGILTQPDRRTGRGKKLIASEVKQLGQSLDIPVFQPERLKPEAGLIADLNADVMVVVAYGMLIPQSILDIPKFGCLNIHASILPKWRGAAPIQRAIEAGDTQTGVSIMQMEASLDTGPVYTTLTNEINSNDTSGTLHKRLAELGATGVLSVLSDLANNSAEPPTEQNHGCATYAHKLDKKEASIDWSDSATSIERRIRAFNPWPICQTYYGDRRLRVWRSKCVSADQLEHSKPGTIVALDESGVVIQCGKGRLLLSSLQKDGGNAMDFKAFRNGFSLEVGHSLTAEPSAHKEPSASRKPSPTK